MSPSTRTIGGKLVDKCRSEAFCFAANASNSVISLRIPTSRIKGLASMTDLAGITDFSGQDDGHHAFRITEIGYARQVCHTRETFYPGSRDTYGYYRIAGVKVSRV